LINKLHFLKNDISVVGEIQFDSDLNEISRQLKELRKPVFLANDRIVFVQDKPDEYPFINGYGKQLIEIQKIVDQIDISNCFVLILTPNTNVKKEIASINKAYSIDSTVFDYCVYPGEYEISVPVYKNTACKKQWNQLYVGTDANVLPCCVADHRFPTGNVSQNSVSEILNSDKDQNIRQWMMQGYRVKECEKCYSQEDNQLQSRREKFVPNKVERDRIKHLDVRLNNICNFKCRMCSEYFSSSIQQETIEIYGTDAFLSHEKVNLNPVTRKSRQSNLDKILPYVSSDLESIYFAGGEPLITEEHYKILDQLINLENLDVQIVYNTNLSKLKFKNKNVLDYWKKFPNVRVGASIDASDLVAEYVRHGTIWKDTLDNINDIKIQTPHVKLEIQSTVQWMNIENLIQLQTKWINSGLFNKEDLMITTLRTPLFLNISSLPVAHKKRLTKKIKNHINNIGQCELAQHWAEAKNFMNSTNSQYTLDEFTKTTQKLDNHRKESFVEVFPQFSDIYSVANDQQI